MGVRFRFRVSTCCLCFHVQYDTSPTSPCSKPPIPEVTMWSFMCMHVMQMNVVRLYVGTFFTSLNMKGASLSLLPVDPCILARLDSPTQAPCWPKNKCEVAPDKKRLPLLPGPTGDTSATRQTRPGKLTQQGAMLERALLAAATAILEHAQELDELDQRLI